LIDRFKLNLLGNKIKHYLNIRKETKRYGTSRIAYRQTNAARLVPGRSFSTNFKAYFITAVISFYDIIKDTSLHIARLYTLFMSGTDTTGKDIPPQYSIHPCR
jgi:hypothetical protein